MGKAGCQQTERAQRGLHDDPGTLLGEPAPVAHSPHHRRRGLAAVPDGITGPSGPLVGVDPASVAVRWLGVARLGAAERRGWWARGRCHCNRPPGSTRIPALTIAGRSRSRGVALMARVRGAGMAASDWSVCPLHLRGVPRRCGGSVALRRRRPDTGMELAGPPGAVQQGGLCLDGCPAWWPMSRSRQSRGRTPSVALAHTCCSAAASSSQPWRRGEAATCEDRPQSGSPARCGPERSVRTKEGV